jgi:hypothetical protein
MSNFQPIYAIRQMPDRTFMVREHTPEAEREVVDGLTIEQATRLRDYLVRLLDTYDFLQKSTFEVPMADLNPRRMIRFQNSPSTDM